MTLHELMDPKFDSLFHSPPDGYPPVDDTDPCEGADDTDCAACLDGLDLSIGGEGGGE